MPITIDLGNLYASRMDEQKHVERRIWLHYYRRKLRLRGVMYACAKYILLLPLMHPRPWWWLVGIWVGTQNAIGQIVTMSPSNSWTCRAFTLPHIMSTWQMQGTGIKGTKGTHRTELSFRLKGAGRNTLYLLTVHTFYFWDSFSVHALPLTDVSDSGKPGMRGQKTFILCRRLTPAVVFPVTAIIDRAIPIIKSDKTSYVLLQFYPLLLTTFF